MDTTREGLTRRAASAILAFRRRAANRNHMRRMPSHTRLIAIALSLCFAAQSLAASASWGAAGNVSLSSAQKAELDKQVQEQLAKDESGAGSTAGTSGLSGGASSASGAALGGTASGGAASSGGGFGASEAFSSLTQQSQPEEEEEAIKSASSATSTASSGISTGVIVPILVAGLLLLGGIAFLILRDARSMAPAAEALSGGNSVQERAARQRKRRAKAKAARQQRKRNR